ncbi:MAG: hypothetical protein QOD81_2481 [Solirubrobacteraceae bacterium]|jgi:hypothetical protein|nr:hypothetical protein [Solirubrobacteraceae bacterium]
MSAVVRVSVIATCAATRPVLDALRAHARLERVAPSEYDAHLDGAADAASAVARLADVLDRDVTPEWDEVVSLSDRPDGPG